MRAFAVFIFYKSALKIVLKFLVKIIVVIVFQLDIKPFSLRHA